MIATYRNTTHNLTATIYTSQHPDGGYAVRSDLITAEGGRHTVETRRADSAYHALADFSEVHSDLLSKGWIVCR